VSAPVGGGEDVALDAGVTDAAVVDDGCAVEEVAVGAVVTGSDWAAPAHERRNGKKRLRIVSRA
jgi:hypothetical protein